MHSHLPWVWFGKHLLAYLLEVTVQRCLLRCTPHVTPPPPPVSHTHARCPTHTCTVAHTHARSLTRAYSTTHTPPAPSHPLFDTRSPSHTHMPRQTPSPSPRHTYPVSRTPAPAPVIPEAPFLPAPLSTGPGLSAAPAQPTPEPRGGAASRPPPSLRHCRRPAGTSGPFSPPARGGARHLVARPGPEGALLPPRGAAARPGPCSRGRPVPRRLWARSRAPPPCGGRGRGAAAGRCCCPPC